MLNILDDFTLPTKITAEYQIITPMFIGDAEKKASHISPQTFKGALRFWWRALKWGEIRKVADSDAKALSTLCEQEATLFGSTAEGKGFVAITLNHELLKESDKQRQWPGSGNTGSSYLGYGITASGKEDDFEPHRESINESIAFNVVLCCDVKTTAQQQQELQHALEYIGLFSGLGSRVRRGFGALQLLSIDDENYTIKSIENYQQKAKKLLSLYQQTPVSPYTSFSGATHIAVHPKLFSSAQKAHNALGNQYKDYRGQTIQSGKTKKKVLGLPLKGIDEKSRRASPLLFHIFEVNNQQYGYAVLYMESSLFFYQKQHSEVDWQLAKNFLHVVGEGK